MSTCIVTGSLGLVGSHAVSFFADKFDKIIGIDNDQRMEFFGTSGVGNLPTFKNYEHYYLDIRKLDKSFFTEDVKLIIHAAGQPS
ncbi:MAG: NAD-dependent epimerase/dehydratase family protein, partial [Chitinophagaceae bacterium]